MRCRYLLRCLGSATERDSRGPQLPTFGGNAGAMKAPDFAYAKPRDLGDALRLLAHAGSDAAPLAGGQSLLAALNLRLWSPGLLVDIGELDELKGLSLEDGVVRIGALTTHTQILESPVVFGSLPLVAEAIKYVAHVAIRNRGTIGGSMAFADPAAELPACAVALGGRLLLASESGQREVPAEAFFKGPFETDLKTGELITEIRFPCQRENDRWVFLELAQRRGDFAIAGAAILASVVGLHIDKARVTYLGCVDRPKLAATVSQRLVGLELPLADLDWISAAVRADIAPTDSPGWRASTKLHLATVLTRRALHGLRKVR
jgi:aerobic carbon-monoxide dehydrogenase medium subunit